jgi:hypothetical protein
MNSEKAMTSQSTSRSTFALAFAALVFNFLTIPLARADSFSITGSLQTKRRVHTATLLPNGKVLVAGGYNYPTGANTAADLYDPATGTWTATAPMNAARAWHTATLLQNGKVLVTGGYGTSWALLSSAELYDPATGTWTVTGSMAHGRYSHTATLLPNGKVLIVGDAGAELYNPASGTWAVTGSPNTPRSGFQTTSLLSNGKVLLAGGVNSSGMISGAELYDPATGTWTATGSMADGRFSHRATLLFNGKVLVSGGFNSNNGYIAGAELYDPASGTWTTTGSLNGARGNHTATLLASGKVLVTGGLDNNYLTLSTAELYDSTSGTWQTISALNVPRYDHTATSLPNGKVLVAAGINDYDYLSSAELYGPILTDPKTPGSTSFSTVIYASVGQQLIPRYQSPSSGYAISRRLDISPFYNAIDSGTWGFDASSVPINGILKVPSGPGPFPVALFVHGNHDPLAFSDEGYIYLCELLASYGILAGTIDANFLNGFSFGENGARGILHLEHVRQFQAWNATPGHPLYGKVNLNKIMLVGHSRGGEGVGHASYYNTYTGNQPVVLDGSAGLGPYSLPLKACVGIAPTDSQYVPFEGPTGIRDNYLIIHGSRDGDVYDFQGYKTYDRAHPINLSNPLQDAAGFKTLLWCVGANHNWFNSTWDNEGNPSVTREEQEDVAKVYINSMAKLMLLDQTDYLRFFQDHDLGKSWLPTSADYISQYQDTKRRFVDHYEEDMNATTLSPPNTGANSWSAVEFGELFFDNGWSIYQETDGARLSWNFAGDFYQAGFTGTGLNAGSYKYLDVRIGQSDESYNPVGADQNLRIVVQDINGSSIAFHTAAFSRLPYPDLNSFTHKMVMQTIRVSLSLLQEQGVNVNNISTVRFTFDQVNSGTVYFDEIQVSN